MEIKQKRHGPLGWTKNDIWQTQTLIHDKNTQRFGKGELYQHDEGHLQIAYN